MAWELKLRVTAPVESGESTVLAIFVNLGKEDILAMGPVMIPADKLLLTIQGHMNNALQQMCNNIDPILKEKRRNALRSHHT